MKKMLLILFSAVLLISGILSSISCACDNSTPEYDGDPISVSGSLRLDKETVFIDLVITNNTNKDIEAFFFTEARSLMAPVEDEMIWLDSDPMETLRGYNRKWYQFWKGPEIKAYKSKSFSYNLQGIRLSNQVGPDTFAQYVKYSMVFNKLDFEGYGFLDINEFNIVLSLEFDLADFSPIE